MYSTNDDWNIDQLFDGFNPGQGLKEQIGGEGISDEVCNFGVILIDAPFLLVSGLQRPLHQ